MAVQLPESEYQPRDDESEARQIAQLSGVGQASYLDDDQIRAYSLEGIGLGLRGPDD